jgi:hypothetical protein
MSQRPLSPVTLSRGAKIYAALTGGATSYNDIMKKTGLGWHEVSNTLHRIRERPHAFGFEVHYAESGPNPNGEKRFYARRNDGVKRPFTKDELRVYMRGEVAKLRLIDTYSRNMARMMKQFEQDFPLAMQPARRAMVANMDAFSATMDFVIQQALKA